VNLLDLLELHAADATKRPWRVSADGEVLADIEPTDDNRETIEIYGGWPVAESMAASDACLVTLVINNLPELVGAVRATMSTAWSERDGRCWCATSPETRDGRHEPRCELARLALEPLLRDREDT